MRVQMPDGTIIENVPEGTTQAQIMARYQKVAAPAPVPTKAAISAMLPADYKPSTLEQAGLTVLAAKRGIQDAAGFGFMDDATKAGGVALPGGSENVSFEQNLQRAILEKYAPTRKAVYSAGASMLSPDPFSKFNAASLPGKIISGAGRGAVSSGLQAAGEAEPGQRMEAAIPATLFGGAVGAAAPVAFAAAKGGYGLAKDFITNPSQTIEDIGSGARRFFTGSLNEGEAAQNAANVVAKRLAEENVTPQMLQQRAAEAAKRGMGETLPEYMQSPALLRKQKVVAKGTGEGGRFLQEYATKRAEEQIPGAVAGGVADIAAKRDIAGNIYENIRKNPIKPADLDFIMLDPILARSANRIEKMVEYSDDISQLGTDKNVVGYWHLVRQNLDSLKKQAETKGADDIARRIGNSRNKLSEVLFRASPEFAEADRLYSQGSAGKEIMDIAKKTTDGHIITLKKKIFGSPEIREKLQKVLTPEEYKGVQSLMQGLSNIAKGSLAGSDTAFNELGKKELAAETGSKALSSLPPTRWLEAATNWYQEKAMARDSEAIARFFVDPDIKALGEKLKGIQRGSPQWYRALEDYTSRTLPKIAGHEVASQLTQGDQTNGQ